MNKDYKGIGFNRSLGRVEVIVDGELKLLDSELAQKYPTLENFCLNLASLAYAQGFEDAKLEDKKEIERLNI